MTETGTADERFGLIPANSLRGALIATPLVSSVFCVSIADPVPDPGAARMAEGATVPSQSVSALQMRSQSFSGWSRRSQRNREC